MIKILQGDCLESLINLESKSINTCVTSPPYFGLRDYGADGQMGLEETPEEFVENLVKVFREVKRVLRDDGTVWLNLGDSYAMSSMRGKNSEFKSISQSKSGIVNVKKNIPHGLKAKDLIGIPWRVAFALQQDGWYLRQDIIWHKPNPMPESVRDRCTKSHEYIFLLSKNKKYYYDNEAIKEPAKQNRWGGKKAINLNNSKDKSNQFNGLTRERDMMPEKRNKRSVWIVTTKPFKGAHFAVFPMDLIEPCVLAGCPEKVCVECDTPYINKPNYRYVNKTSSIKNNHGKYKTQQVESSNRQGLHSNRGSKLVEIREDLPKQSLLVDFLRSKTNPKLLSENSDIPTTKIEHWFRRDEGGFAYPSIDDWKKVRDLIDDYSDEFHQIDKSLSECEYKTDAIQSKEIINYELKKQCNCETNETISGTVLDPFGGSGTTGLVAQNNNRNAILLELNPEYIEIAESRLYPKQRDFLKARVVA